MILKIVNPKRRKKFVNDFIRTCDKTSKLLFFLQNGTFT